MASLNSLLIFLPQHWEAMAAGFGFSRRYFVKQAASPPRRLRVLKEFLRQTGCLSPPRVTELARRILDFDCPGDGVISSLIEQEPNPNSRVSLTNDVDSFGLRRT